MDGSLEFLWILVSRNLEWITQLYNLIRFRRKYNNKTWLRIVSCVIAYCVPKSIQVAYCMSDFQISSFTWKGNLSMSM